MLLASKSQEGRGRNFRYIYIFMIEIRLFTFSYNTWVFDTGYVTHICNLLRGFKKSRELKADEMVLYVCIRARVSVQAIGQFDLRLPFGCTCY